MTAIDEAGPRGRMVLGLLLVGLGLVLTLGQAGILDLAGLGRFWPLLLIGVGIVKFRQPLADGQRAIGAGLLFSGSLFLAVGALTWGRGWPVALVGIGAFLLFKAIVPHDQAPQPVLQPWLSELALLGASRRCLRLPDFRGGYVTAMLGAVELDLRQARMLGSSANLDVVAVWGGIDLKVPSEWSVEGRVLPFLGAFDDQTRPLVESAEGPRLVIRGHAIMGGVVVSN